MFPKDRMMDIARRVRTIWQGVVWYMREISGEARYEHYLERFAAEHPEGTPMSETEYIRAREEYDKRHPNTSCCC